MTRGIVFLLKLVISSSLLLWIASQIDLDVIGETLRDLNIFWLVLSTGLLFARSWVGGLRSRMLLLRKEIDVSVNYSAMLYIIALFFNMFLPTAVGGDVYRVYALGKRFKNLSACAAAVLMERIGGLLSLVLLSFTSIPLALLLLDANQVVYIAIIFDFVVVAAAAILLHPWLERALRNIRFGFLGNVTEKMSRFSQSLRQLAEPRTLVKLIFSSLAFQFAGILSVYWLAEAVHMEIGFTAVLLSVPLTYLVSMVPITLNGAGLREGTLIFLFGLLGAGEQESILIGFLVLAQLIFLATIGGVVYVAVTVFNEKRTLS